MVAKQDDNECKAPVRYQYYYSIGGDSIPFNSTSRQIYIDPVNFFADYKDITTGIAKKLANIKGDIANSAITNTLSFEVKVTIICNETHLNDHYKTTYPQPMTAPYFEISSYTLGQPEKVYTFQDITSANVKCPINSRLLQQLTNVGSEGSLPFLFQFSSQSTNSNMKTQYTSDFGWVGTYTFVLTINYGYNQLYKRAFTHAVLNPCSSTGTTYNELFTNQRSGQPWIYDLSLHDSDDLSISWTNFESILCYYYNFQIDAGSLASLGLLTVANTNAVRIMSANGNSYASILLPEPQM
ncbi:hypothetical protein FGO68_gene10642 [Halteria grandinella]|uniref:Uncharacterized protein n=1 Tax=Halteria grandinella TaxID=5974 RepID=A0A8J8NFG9_HALGN|nr:hypothetical protein FGO68_gene10642 [Halteria grandinella]